MPPSLSHLYSWCKLCAMILSDDDIKPEDVKDAKAE